MNRLASLLFNVMTVIALLVGATVLLFNVAFSPSWQRLNPGILPTEPIQWLFYDDNSPINQPRILQTVNLWARLAPLPTSANNIVVDSDGELFSKVYIVRFDAPAPDVEQWLQHSQGIIDETPDPLDDGKLYYRIRPRDASFADVTIASDHQHVRVRGSWYHPLGVE
ncbi:MAG: hypothetical protein VKL39_18970 [Leptolyngbyaceae bacterium]|nr:hypothetical protein [Leptolyngbyaceae bacterium]